MKVSCYGQAFRKIRKERKVSLKEAAADIISPQLLSQFELGKKNVSLTNFDQLLESIGVSLLEFAQALELEGTSKNQLSSIISKKEETLALQFPARVPVFPTFLSLLSGEF